VAKANEWTTSIPEAGAKYYGLNEDASYEAAKRGDIPFVQVGRLKRVPVKVLEQRLSTEPNPTNPAPQQT
jgi:hypothetical protein